VNGRGGNNNNNNKLVENKECRDLSPCLTEYNKFDKNLLRPEDEEFMNDRIESIELLHAWYIYLWSAVDYDTVKRLILTAASQSGSSCVPKQLVDRLRDLLTKMDKIRDKSLPDLEALHGSYMQLQ